jgi:hypothetical protein
MSALLTAIVTGSVALVIASFTVWATAPLRRLEFDKLVDELDECRNDRRALRGRLELLEQTLLGLLPPRHRDALLEQLDAYTPPYDVPEAA